MRLAGLFIVVGIGKLMQMKSYHQVIALEATRSRLSYLPSQSLVFRAPQIAQQVIMKISKRLGGSLAISANQSITEEDPWPLGKLLISVASQAHLAKWHSMRI